MKLSCLPVSFFDDIAAGRMSIGEWARLGAELALDAIDMSILFLSQPTLQAALAARKQIEQAGMRLAMLTSYPDFTHPDPDQRDLELEKEIQVVRIASALGALFVRVTAGQAHPQTATQDGISWAVQGLTRLAEATQDMGVQLVYENHAKPGAWQYTDFSQPPEVFLEILSQLPAPEIGVNFDTGNAAAFSPDPVAFLRQILPRVVSLHASDTQQAGRLSHVLLGTGVTPFPAIFHTLKTAGWDGWICMEEASFKGRKGVELAAQYIRQTWQSA